MRIMFTRSRRYQALKCIKRWVFALILSSVLVACGSSYSVPRAILHVDASDPQEIALIRERVVAYMESRDFIYQGIDNKMIDLMQRAGTEEDVGNDNLIDRYRRTRDLNNPLLKMRMTLVDYSDPLINKSIANYPHSLVEQSEFPALEINLYESRPGGFSEQGHRVFTDLHAFLEATYGEQVHVLFNPPETNRKEYLKTILINFIAMAFWWLLVYSFAIWFIGSMVVSVLKRTRLSINQKRSIFTLLGALLATPLPFSLGIVGVMILPSVFSLLALGGDFFTRVADFAVPSLLVSLVISFLLSSRFLKDSPDDSA